MNRLAAILLTSLIFPPISPPTFSNLPAIDGIQARVGTEVGTLKSISEETGGVKDIAFWEIHNASRIRIFF